MRSDQSGRPSSEAHSTVIHFSLRRALLSRGMIALMLTGMTFTACRGAEKAAAPLTPPDDGGIDEAEIPSPAVIYPALIQTPTYDGTGELVHPDAVVFPERWKGRRYWVSATPYPTGNPKYENPSIYQGYRATQMSVPAGANNPLATPGSLGGYLSDPDMLYDPDRDQLRMYYRHTTSESDQILVMTSENGVQWSTPQPVLTGSRYGIISPAIIRERLAGRPFDFLMKPFDINELSRRVRACIDAQQ